MRFSERHGFKEVRTAIQFEDMDKDLRTDLWNTIILLFRTETMSTTYSEHSDLCRQLWMDFFKEPYDEIPHHPNNMETRIRSVVLGSAWYEVYDLIEYLVGFVDDQRAGQFSRFINHDLARNLAGYRLLSNQIVPIDSEVELNSLEDVITGHDTFDVARKHLSKALRLLSDRDAPDYANSVKESISAVESVCRILTGKNSLGAALKELNKDGNIHSALMAGWEKIYGYTSDAHGIRHGSINESEVNQATAKYFLVACSAFVSLLISDSAENSD